MQCLTAEHAKQMLREGASVLDSALDAGLSGPGRLHDLCVKLGAAHAVLQEIPTAQPTALRPLRAFVKGSKFQIRVWRALLRIPPGSAVSYGRLAAIGNRLAFRAVGTAVGANPLAYLIPCPRVIRQTGALGH